MYRRIDFLLLLSLMVLLFFPQFAFVQFGLSSLAYGLLIAGFFVFLLNIKYINIVKIKKHYYFLFFLFFLYLLVVSVYFYIKHGEIKPLVSIGALMLPLLSMIPFSGRMLIVDNVKLFSTFKILLFLVLLIGWLDIVFDVRPLAYQFRYKPVFPFSEESHYALVIGVLACACGAVSKFNLRLFIFFNLILQSFIFPNLTLLVFSLLFFYLNILRINFITFPIIVAFIFVSAVLIYFYVDLTYFSSRIILSTDSTNLTSLVYMQGWEEAFNSLRATYGLGLGFQNLGTQPAGLFGERIFSLFGDYFNREDGGFLASKLIAELGVIGLIVCLVYMGWVLFYLLMPNRRFARSISDPRSTFFTVLIISYSVEFFLRGYGYFSPGLMLVFASLLQIRTKVAN